MRLWSLTADPNAVTINTNQCGRCKIIQLRPELFNVVGDNHFASMFFQGVGKINWMQRDISLLTIHLGCFCHWLSFYAWFEIRSLTCQHQWWWSRSIAASPGMDTHGPCLVLPSKGPQEGWCEGGIASWHGIRCKIAPQHDSASELEAFFGHTQLNVNVSCFGGSVDLPDNPLEVTLWQGIR